MTRANETISEAEKPQKRARGQGSIFKNGSDVWWIKFPSGGGRQHRESSHSTDYAVAERLLNRRLAQVDDDRFVPTSKVRLDELVADVISDYKENGKKSVEHVERRWKCHLARFFSQRKASEITTGTVRRYIAARAAQGAARASVNRELAVLRRAFNLARKSSPPKVAVVPYIPLFRETNRRTGFLEAQAEARLAAECARIGLWLRTAFEIGLTYGWRRGEVQNLRVRQVNLLRRTLSLDVGTTKNDEGRCVRLTDAIVPLLSECMRGKKPDDYLLTRDDRIRKDSTRVKGTRVRDLRKSWHRACCLAGVGRMTCPNCISDEGERFELDAKKHCPNCGREVDCHAAKYQGLLFHDLRRSMARNMRNEGIAEEIIMDIGGWKTASVFKRYSIVNPNDTADAIRRSEAARRRDQALIAAQNSGSGQVWAELRQSLQAEVEITDLDSRDSHAAVLPN